ncbi:hypothetical protein ABWH96_05510 [Marivirga tractuosa]|uniref:hypothetical protein n=1 Tax=Marivirga tractuosa TaxID=1006 RepID=UPI0035CF0881
MYFWYLLIFVYLLPFYSFSQIENQEHAQEIYTKTLNHIDKGLSYLESAQQKESDSIFKYKGEWETQMSMNFWFPLLGRENSSYDSNCFSVATIHNILANIYLEYPEYRKIPPMLDMAFDRIMNYQSDGTFNFWNLLPPKKAHRFFEKETDELVRRPNNFPLKIKFMHKAANVANDADDTAAGLLAIYLRNKINGNQIPDSLKDIHNIFDEYTDSNRNNRLWYNFWQKQGSESGAYLTWLADEHKFSKNWNPVQEFFHLGTFYLPISKMYPHAYQPYIPYGSNDLDPVVNANILRVLSKYNNDRSHSAEKSIQFIEDEIIKENYEYAATYYPNKYHLPYYISKAYKNDVKGLGESSKLIEEFVIREYKENGSWSSRGIINNGDSLQSTILAVNALLNISGIRSEKSQAIILDGLDYIFSKGIKHDGKIFWKGGVFFSGGTLVRHVLHWKSDAVTTAMVLEALITLRKQLELQYPSLE